MKSSQTHPLTGIVHVDEFLIGEYEQGVVGRSHNSKKRLVIVALEIVEKGVGRAYAQVIEHQPKNSNHFLRYNGNFRLVS